MVPFNYAAKANFALRVCRTEQLVMLNDDMEIINPGLAGEPGGTLAGAGNRRGGGDGCCMRMGRSSMLVALSVFAADRRHVYHSFPGEFIGYNGFTHLIRNYSAVTGACLATRKSVVAQIGGFDESFAVDFNDTDLCLRMIEAGYRIVYTPYCQLFHFEGASAQRSKQNIDEHRRFVARWARFMENDPYFNPNFARDRFDFTVA